MSNRILLYSTLLAASTAASLLQAQTLPVCGTLPPTAEENQLHEAIISSYSSLYGDETEFTEVVEIPVAFHVIDNGLGAVVATDQQLLDQIAVFNSSYADQNIHFILHSVNRYTDSLYWELERTERPGMLGKYNLNEDYIANIYIVYHGYAVGDANIPESPRPHGIAYDYRSLPGGSRSGNNDGKVLVHEMGHFLGLRHTFSEGAWCEDTDLVADTPAHEFTGNYTPPEGTDTCPEPGLDPIHNYMNYVLDAWMEEFTTGQKERIVQMVTAQRDLMLTDYIWADYPVDPVTNMRSVPWFGNIWDKEYPWFYHGSHGWMYNASGSEDSWYYDPTMNDWL